MCAPSASADVNSDQTQITQLGTRIAQDGLKLQALVAAYDQEQRNAATASQRVQAAQARLVADRASADTAVGELRSLALDAYMHDTADYSSLSLFASTNDPTAWTAKQESTGLASAGLHQIEDKVAADIRQAEVDIVQLRASESQAQAALSQLSSARQAAESALAQDTALLSHVKNDLAAVLAAQAAARLAAERAAEVALAQQGAAHPVNTVVDPTPGSYANPLRSVSALQPERIDQGVDYHGYGQIFAVGNGRVLSTSNSGWPGGTFISYKLTDGPANGLVVYAAEDIFPLVHVGQSVDVNTVLGTMYEGPDGIETGWADPSGDGVSMASDYRQFRGANSTAFGANFSQMLAWLGATPGVMQNNPATGNLPPHWPSWPPA